MHSDAMNYCKGPDLKESRDINLYRTKGRVLSISEFCCENIKLLKPQEQNILNEYSEDLLQIEPLFTSPMVRSSSYFDGKQSMPAKRSGTRSAYIPSIGIKIKGCRPGKATFPSWKLNEELGVDITQLPFGVLTAESVMREILAYSFIKKYELPTISKPNAIFEYKQNSACMQYALVSQVSCETRVEQYIDCMGYMLYDIIRLKRLGKLTKSEVGLKRIDKDTYGNKKTDLLLSYNINGGFRGILNSNIGNDIISNEQLFCLCDFDSFKIIPFTNGDSFHVRLFIINAFVELIKTSLPFNDFRDVSHNDIVKVHSELINYYQANSTIYRLFKKKFIRFSQIQKWPSTFVDKSISEAFESPAAFELLQELIPNTYTLENIGPNSIYVPHN